MAKDTPRLQMGDRRDPSRRASQKRSKKAAAQEAEEISIAASLVKMRFNGRSPIYESHQLFNKRRAHKKACLGRDRL
jgi:hypothetical protein